MVSCGRLSGVGSFVLEVRSRSGNDVPVNLYQMKVILCSDKKRHSQPSEVRVLAKRQTSVSTPLGQVPRPCPAFIAEEPGTHNPTDPLAPQATPMVGAGSWGLHPMWDSGCHYVTKVETGSGFMVTSRPGMRPMGVPSKGSGSLQDTAPGLFLPRLFLADPPAPC